MYFLSRTIGYQKTKQNSWTKPVNQVCSSSWCHKHESWRVVLGAVLVTFSSHTDAFIRSVAAYLVCVWRYQHRISLQTPEIFSFSPYFWSIFWVRVLETAIVAAVLHRAWDSLHFPDWVTEVAPGTQRELDCFELLKDKPRQNKNFKFEQKLICIRQHQTRSGGNTGPQELRKDLI